MNSILSTIAFILFRYYIEFPDKFQNLKTVLNNKWIIDIAFLLFFIFNISFLFLGVVESAKKYKCTPKQTLDCKEFFEDSSIGGTCFWLMA